VTARRPRGCILRALGFYGLFVAAVVSLWLVGGHTVAAWRLRGERRAWAEAGASMDELRARFPPTPDSEAARELDVLTQAVGAPVIFDPGNESIPEQDWFQPNREFLDQLGGNADVELRPPAPVVADHLRTHRAALRRAAAYLIEHPGIQWETDLDQGPEAPIPSLLGLRTLQELLVAEAVRCTQRGDLAAARELLLATKRLSDTASSRAELLSQLVAVALDQSRHAALRHLPPELGDWLEGQPSSLHRQRMALALQGKAYSWFIMARQYRGVGDLELPASGPFAGGPVAVSLRVLSVPYVRLAAVDIARHTRAVRDIVLSDDPCGATDKVQQLEESAGRKGLLSKIATDGLALAVGIGLGTDLDAELTRAVRAARRYRRAHGRWPADTTVTSAVCAEVAWRHHGEPDGRLTIEGQPAALLAGLEKSRSWSYTLSPEGIRP